MLMRRTLQYWHKISLPQNGRYNLLGKRYSRSSVSEEDPDKRFTQHLKGFRPRRAILYVPASDERKINKVSSLNADCIVLDCEDGVAMNKKDDARNNIVAFLPKLVENHESEICVRINSVSSELYEEDLQTVLNARTLPRSMMLPKVEKWEEIDAFFSFVKPILKPRQTPLISFIIFIETALGVVNLKKIIESAVAYCVTSKFRFEGIVFGSDDYCASIGVQRSNHSNELLYARQKIITYAKAFNLQAIDMVYINYKDENGLRAQSLEGCGMGFTGKQVIHPNQVDIVQECYSPSPDRIEWAEELISAFQEHQNEGKGAFTFHGKMIDMPLLKQAQSIVNMSNSLNLNDK